MIYKAKRDGFCELVMDDFIVKRIAQALEGAIAAQQVAGGDDNHGAMADYVDIYTDLYKAVPAKVYNGWNTDYLRE